MFLIILNVFLLTIIAGYLGTVIFSKRMTLAIDPLGHLSLPGIALALIYNFNIFFGALPFIIFGIFLIWFLEIKTKLPLELLTAVIFSSGIGISFLFLPIEKAEQALIGDVTQINLTDTILNIFVFLIIFLLIYKIYNSLILMNILEDYLKIENKNPDIFNFLYLFCFALFVSIGVKIMGGLLITSLIALPTASARNLSYSLKSFKILSILFGLLSSILALIVYQLTDLPLSVLIIIFNFILFLLSVLIKNLKN